MVTHPQFCFLKQTRLIDVEPGMENEHQKVVLVWDR